MLSQNARLVAPRPGLEPGTSGLTVYRGPPLFQRLRRKSVPQLSQIRRRQSLYWRGTFWNCGTQSSAPFQDYSVPWRLIGRSAKLTLLANEYVRILHAGQEVAIHTRFAGQRRASIRGALRNASWRYVPLQPKLTAQNGTGLKMERARIAASP